MKCPNLNLLLSLALTLVLASLPCFAADKPELKPAVPQLDSVTPQEAPPIVKPTPKPSSSLKGGVQHSVKHADPKMQYGLGKMDWDRLLHGEAQDKSQGLEATVQSGIGIIGVKFVMSMGRPPVINRVFPLTPAFKAGLLPNDIIVAVDGIPTVGLTKEEVYDMIVGLPGTEVTISINRHGDYQSQTMMRMDLNDITDPFVRRDYLTNM